MGCRSLGFRVRVGTKVAAEARRGIILPENLHLNKQSTEIPQAAKSVAESLHDACRILSAFFRPPMQHPKEA